MTERHQKVLITRDFHRRVIGSHVSNTLQAVIAPAWFAPEVSLFVGVETSLSARECRASLLTWNRLKMILSTNEYIDLLWQGQHHPQIRVTAVDSLRCDPLLQES